MDDKKALVSSEWNLLFQKLWPTVENIPKEQCIGKLLLLGMEEEWGKCHTALKRSKPEVDQSQTEDTGEDSPVLYGWGYKRQRTEELVDDSGSPFISDMSARLPDNAINDYVVLDDGRFSNIDRQDLVDSDPTQAPLRGLGKGSDGQVNIVYESDPIYESQ